MLEIPSKEDEISGKRSVH